MRRPLALLAAAALLAVARAAANAPTEALALQPCNQNLMAICIANGGVAATCARTYGCAEPVAAASPAASLSASASASLSASSSGSGSGSSSEGFPTVAARDAPITRELMIKRAMVWVDAKMAYNQQKWAKEFVTEGKTYRQDCSGFVSLAWGLSTSRTTAYMESQAPCTRVDRDDMLPGDVFLYPGHHVVVFNGWVDANMTHYYALEEKGTKWGTIAHERLTPSAKSGYFGCRYNRVIEDNSSSESDSASASASASALGSSAGSEPSALGASAPAGASAGAANSAASGAAGLSNPYLRSNSDQAILRRADRIGPKFVDPAKFLKWNKERENDPDGGEGVQGDMV